MLAKQSAIYFVSKLIPAGVTLCALSVYSHFLSSQEYGLVAWTLSSAALGFSFAISWLCAAVVRLDSTAESRVSFQTTVAAMLGVLAIAIGGSLLGIVEFVKDERIRWSLGLGYLILCLTGWIEINLAFLMARFRVDLYGTLNIVRALLSGIFGGLFAYLGWGAVWTLTGTALGLLAPSIWLLATNWRELVPAAIDLRAFRSICQYGLPLVGGYALYGLATNIDRQILIVLHGASAVGLYAIGFELADKTIGALMSPVGTAGLPLAVDALERKGISAATEQMSRNFVLLTAIGLPSAAGLALLAPDLVDLMLGEEFQVSAAYIIPICAGGAFLRSLRSFYIDHAFQLGKKTAGLTVVMFFTALISIALNFCLIPLMGMTGAAYAALGTQAGGLVIGFLLGNRAFPLRPPLRDTGKIAFSTVLMSLAVIWLGEGEGIIWTAMRATVGAATFLAVCLILNVARLRHTLTTQLNVFLK